LLGGGGGTAAFPRGIWGAAGDSEVACSH
jgi:hypothetical protein